MPNSPFAAADTTLKPYLELPHILSLSWLAYPVISLGFIAFKVIQAENDAQESLQRGKETLFASCRAAEHASTGATSLPRYMAVATNQQIQDTVNAAARNARAALILAITIMEAIINFVISIYRSTLLCFIEFGVRATLGLLISATEQVRAFPSTMLFLTTSLHLSYSSLNLYTMPQIPSLIRSRTTFKVSIQRSKVHSQNCQALSKWTRHNYHNSTLALW
jgi:hypothetical protein